MSSVQFVNSQAEVMKKAQALAMNITAGKGLFDVMKSNLGPKGTIKMLVGGAGQIKLTKDGCVLLHEMQIKHPTAAMIARCATAQDVTVGDGTTSNVLFIGELLKQAEQLIYDGVHPRLITEGYELAKTKSCELLEEFKLEKKVDSALMTCIAQTSLNTKLQPNWANMLVPMVVGAVQCVSQTGKQIDLNMVEIMHMVHRQASETRLVNGLVLDHGGRHSDMPNQLKNCFILTANVSLEYEKTEIHSGFYFSTAEQREKLVQSERKFTDERCQKIIDLKRLVCKEGQGFVLINQKGIDPVCLEMLARENIIGLRRAKRRNMERLMLCCGGRAVNAVDGITPEDLGWADSVKQETLGDDKYTFVEGCNNAKSCTILVKGPDPHTIAQLKDAIRDGLRAVKNVIEDSSVIPGAGAFEVFAHKKLVEYADTVEGKAKLGVAAFGRALLVIPKILAENAGYDVQDALIMLQDEFRKQKVPVGLDLEKFGVLSPTQMGIFDNYCVKKLFITLSNTLAQQLLLCDEILKAGRQMGGDRDPGARANAPY